MFCDYLFGIIVSSIWFVNQCFGVGLMWEFDVWCCDLMSVSSVYIVWPWSPTILPCHFEARLGSSTWRSLRAPRSASALACFKLSVQILDNLHQIVLAKESWERKVSAFHKLTKWTAICWIGHVCLTDIQVVFILIETVSPPHLLVFHWDKSGSLCLDSMGGGALFYQENRQVRDWSIAPCTSQPLQNVQVR